MFVFNTPKLFVFVFINDLMLLVSWYDEVFMIG